MKYVLIKEFGSVMMACNQSGRFAHFNYRTAKPYRL